MFDSQKIVRLLKSARKIPAEQEAKRQRAWQQFATYLLSGVADQSKTYQYAQRLFMWLCYEDTSNPLSQEVGSLFIFLREHTESVHLLYHYGFWEGMAYQRRTNRLALFVPAQHEKWMTAHIAPCSAIVGKADDGEEEVTIYYEGNLHGYAGVVTYADRAKKAADRLLADYPTSAFAAVPRSALLQVGWFGKTGVTLLDDEHAKGALASWLEVQVIDPQELRFSSQ
ncbi:hypothetical protein KSF_107740 [Reticulibacter mediterranei]|uniref:Uncharacterized protein n=1 Tax=Reticulibacter mediterranei TaxID=2778369 RepID=A0A8J3J376_9CHLR|nr:hypothetical protein [Reticulibacter mediterranei]GHP00727.1 hypothetical protein KSF_107740 [Reticulibacter mediterranei]